MTFPLMPLSQVVKPVSRPVEVVPGQSYRTIGVRLWGQGAYERETIDGSQTAAKTLFIVRQGDLIINKIWVRSGTTAVAGADVDGCAASGEFPTFEIDQRLVLPRWLHWLTKTRQFWNSCDALSRGTSGKNRIKPELFLTIEIPLPPLAEQRSIVARIEELAVKIEEVRGMRRAAREEAKSFERSSLDEVYLHAKEAFGLTSLSDVAISITDGDHMTPAFAESGVKFIFVGNVASGYLHFNGCKYVDPAYYSALRPHRKPQRGDILYSAVGMTLGNPAVVDRDEAFCFQRHVAIIKPDHNKVLAKYLWYMLRTSILFRYAWLKTTGSAQPTIPLSAIRTFQFPLPPMDEQRRIVERLDALQAQVEAVRQLQEQTEAELAALLPAVLDKAFRGAL